MLRKLLTVVAIVNAASSVLANDENDCFQGHEPQQRIKGCSIIIERFPNDATAYHNRAFAYEMAGDLDKAIADYSKVIALAPNNASAYANRGRAYASKGDHMHAVEDDAKAQGLIAQGATQLAVTTKTGKVRKRMTAAVTNSAIATPKKMRIPKANTKVGGKKGLSDYPWAWLWGNGADQAGGRGSRTARKRDRKS
jgi:tetratricopeptide (TPR) repeat protein